MGLVYTFTNEYETNLSINPPFKDPLSRHPPRPEALKLAILSIRPWIRYYAPSEVMDFTIAW